LASAGPPFVRVAGLAYRGHDPRWAFDPVSGDGAAVRGARFNPEGVPALYLSLTPETLFKEASHGFPHRFDPLTVCAYEVDCQDVVDLTDPEVRRGLGIALETMGSPWMLDIAEGRRPRSWVIHDGLRQAGAAGILVPSFANGAVERDRNLVLWTWGPEPPHQVRVIDPLGRLPRDQSSWEAS
jgi:RES domain-containing protein